MLARAPVGVRPPRPYNVGQHRAKTQLKIALKTEDYESKLRRLQQVMDRKNGCLLDRKDQINKEMTNLAVAEISGLKLRLACADDIFNIKVNEVCKVDRETRGRAPQDPGETDGAALGTHTCVNGCGRKPFRDFSTCCTHCKGPDGPHAGGCGKKADGDFAWIRSANDEEDRAARREVSKLTEKTISCRGYVMGPTKVDLIHVERMLEGTQIISATKGNWPKEKEDEGAEAAKEETADAPKQETEEPKEEIPKETVQLRIEKGLVFQEATKASLEGKRVVAVNAASSYHLGGGFKTGGRHALEEAMCVQSTLYASLVSAGKLAEQAKVVAPEWVKPAQKLSGVDWYQHIPDDGCVLSPYVEVFRGGTNDGYPFEESAVMLEAVVSVAMPNCNARMSDSPVDAHPVEEDYMAQLKRKWRAVFTAASQYTQADTVVIPDAGCGVFRNPPRQVGTACGEVLREEFSSSFKELVVIYPGGRNGDEFAEYVQASFEGRTPLGQEPEAPDKVVPAAVGKSGYPADSQFKEY